MACDGKGAKGGAGPGGSHGGKKRKTQRKRSRKGKLAQIAVRSRGGYTRWVDIGADPHGGLGGIKPPYLPNTHGYPP